MPVTRLFPLSTDVSGSDWTTFGASPAHVALSDANDGSGLNRQLSSFEPVHHASGTAMTQLPASSGVIKQLTLGFRVSVDIADSASSFARILYAGTPLLTVSIANVPTVLTTFTAIGGVQPFIKINALTWYVQSDFIAHGGVQTIATELWLDVEWYPISGFQALIY